ncbi:hypothetical protein NDU88_010385, partial [Pleurodeles waltl]
GCGIPRSPGHLVWGQGQQDFMFTLSLGQVGPTLCSTNPLAACLQRVELSAVEFNTFASFAVDPCGFGSSCPAVCRVACFSGISLVIAVSVQSSCL